MSTRFLQLFVVLETLFFCCACIVSEEGELPDKSEVIVGPGTDEFTSDTLLGVTSGMDGRGCFE